MGLVIADQEIRVEVTNEMGSGQFWSNDSLDEPDVQIFGLLPRHNRLPACKRARLILMCINEINLIVWRACFSERIDHQNSASNPVSPP